MKFLTQAYRLNCLLNLNKPQMLLNDFFHIIEKKETENELIFDVKINKSHQIFEGHFPEQPIAPGVCLAQMVKEVCEQQLANDLKLVSARNMKFMAILDPNKDECVSIYVKIKENEGIYSVKAHCSSKETLFFKIDAKYQF